MVLVHDTSSRRGLQVYQVSLKNLFNSFQVIERTRFVTDRRTDGQTDRQTDRRTGKNNMSPDPVWGRHNEIAHEKNLQNNLKDDISCYIHSYHFILHGMIITSLVNWND